MRRQLVPWSRACSAGCPICTASAVATKEISDDELARRASVTVGYTPERGAVVQQARELVHLARRHGYRTDELIEIVRDVG